MPAGRFELVRSDRGGGGGQTFGVGDATMKFSGAEARRLFDRLLAAAPRTSER